MLLTERLRTEELGFLVSGRRILAYTPPLSDVRLYILVKSAFNATIYELMTNSIIALVEPGTEKVYLHKIGLNEWTYGILQLARYGLLEFKEVDETIEIDLKRGVDRELRELLEEYRHTYFSPHSHLDYLLHRFSDKYPGLWQLIKIYYENKSVDPKTVDSLVSSVLEYAELLDVQLSEEKERVLRDSNTYIVKRLEEAIELAYTCLDTDPPFSKAYNIKTRNSVRRRILEYIRSEVSRRTPIDDAEKILLDRLDSIWKLINDKHRMAVDKRIWRYQVIALCRKMRTDSTLVDRLLSGLEERHEHHPRTSERASVLREEDIVYSSRYRYTLEYTAKLFDELKKVLREARETYDDQLLLLLLEEAYKKLKELRRVLGELANMAWRARDSNAYQMYIESRTEIDSMCREVKEEIERLEWELEEEQREDLR